MSGEILREDTAFNGNLLRLIYNSADLGDKYSIKYQRSGENGFRSDTCWATQGEANRYFDKLMSGGRQ